jgi:hypothetical protein
MSVLKKVLYRSLALIGLCTGIMLFLDQPERHTSAFTHEEVEKINPVIIVDKYTFLDASNYGDMMSSALERLTDMGVIIATPFGPVVNPTLPYGSYSIPVIIQSGGGLTKLGLDLVKALGSLKKAGIKVTCHVGEAQSMAMSLMVISCDKVIAKKKAILMQHRVSYGSSGTTPSTFQADSDLSRMEAAMLDVKYEEWHALARGSEDHIFTQEEIKKYNLVDEWVD